MYIYTHTKSQTVWYCLWQFVTVPEQVSDGYETALTLSTNHQRTPTETAAHVHEHQVHCSHLQHRTHEPSLSGVRRKLVHAYRSVSVGSYIVVVTAIMDSGKQSKRHCD